VLPWRSRPSSARSHGSCDPAKLRSTCARMNGELLCWRRAASRGGDGMATGFVWCASMQVGKAVTPDDSRVCMTRNSRFCCCDIELNSFTAGYEPILSE